MRTNDWLDPLEKIIDKELQRSESHHRRHSYKGKEPIHTHHKEWPCSQVQHNKTSRAEMRHTVKRTFSTRETPRTHLIHSENQNLLDALSGTIGIIWAIFPILPSNAFYHQPISFVFIRAHTTATLTCGHHSDALASEVPKGSDNKKRNNDETFISYENALDAHRIGATYRKSTL